jgi:hypothetical protein
MWIMTCHRERTGNLSVLVFFIAGKTSVSGLTIFSDEQLRSEVSEKAWSHIIRCLGKVS